MIHVVLYEPEIPQNTGNIMRTCMAFGCRLHLIEPLGFYLDESHLRRAGMDYVKELEYEVHSDWDSFLAAHGEGELFFLTRYGHQTPDAFDYAACARDIYLVFGKEFERRFVGQGNHRTGGGRSHCRKISGGVEY